MIPTSDRPTFSLELHELLLWFGKLRWFAAAGLALGALAGLRFGTLQLWPTLLILAITVASYNLLCWWLLLRLLGEDSFLTNLQVTSIVEIVLDLSVLLVVVHLTGGLASPIAPFFIFHMAIGIAMLSARTMFVIATGTCIAMVLLHIGESSAYLSRHAIADGPDAYGALPGLRFAVLLAVVFGTVYLTWTVKQRSEEYKRIADFVAEEGRQKLEEAFSEISDLENRKSHFMRISAHQLRSPLGTIKTTLQVITKGYTDADSDRGKRLLNGAVERTDELLSIVNDLLELAKIREGQEKAPWTRNVNVNEILTEIVESLKTTADAREIQLTARLNEQAIISWGVPPDLRFAFENLVHNAVKYSGDGSEVKVSVTFFELEMSIAVVDEGIGIPEELVEDVFLEFVRAPNAKHHAEGTGLGLSIVKAVVEAHGGRIYLASTEGVGTIVTVSLPFQNVPPETVLALLGESASA